MISYKTIKNKRWYYRLFENKERNQKGLFSFFPRNQLLDKLIVRLTFAENGKRMFLYTFFKSYIDFAKFSFYFQDKDKCFYEIILGEKMQKPHFDIDIEKDADINHQEIKDNLIDSIIKTLTEKNVILNLQKDLLVYSSHGFNKKNIYKYSYHIVVNNYCHLNNIEAKAFYEHVVENVKQEYKKYIDKAVYSPTQNFRILGSRKYQSERVKKLEKNWTYHDKTIIHEYNEIPEDKKHEFIIQLEESIVTARKANCNILPIFKTEDDTKNYTIIEENVSKDDAKNAFKKLAEKANVTPDDIRFPYRISGINGPIIMLKRTRPSKCKICNRVHEHENPYLIIVGEEKSVYFHCRRAATGKKLFIGKLNEKIKDDKFDLLSEKYDLKWKNDALSKIKAIAKNSDGVKKLKIGINTSNKINDEHRIKMINNFVNNNN